MKTKISILLAQRIIAANKRQACDNWMYKPNAPDTLWGKSLVVNEY